MLRTLCCLEMGPGGSARQQFSQEGRRSGGHPFGSKPKQKPPDLLSSCLIVGVAVACIVSTGCSDPEKERLKQTTKATYDQNTGRLKELTYDANKNGRIDTWTDMDGTRPPRARIDR